MANKYIELWIEKHDKPYCDHVLSRMSVTQLNQVKVLAKGIILDGQRTKSIKLKQEHLSLSTYAFFSGAIGLFSSLLMPIFFKNGSVAISSLGALTTFASSLEGVCKVCRKVEKRTIM
ncbi:hypothetical protein [Wolbachia endosymbiont of Ctenocephalides felis wCfeT]|uniref:hypothetical protein n=1 Tax=Wolbachia endosymbiont of Ctenocephalides felis wCfeT TaxID=2732593 RepID=UPI001444F96B|nr:hypothetical protein [Wolbachia endosymbiont of Ctenocephalides felis wCfeT]